MRRAFRGYIAGPFEVTLAQWLFFLARHGVDLSLSRVAPRGDEVMAFALIAGRPPIGRWRLATLLTIHDMCKAIDRGMVIEGVRLLEKRGGKSSTWVAWDPAPSLG